MNDEITAAGKTAEKNISKRWHKAMLPIPFRYTDCTWHRNEVVWMSAKKKKKKSDAIQLLTPLELRDFATQEIIGVINAWKYKFLGLFVVYIAKSHFEYCAVGEQHAVHHRDTALCEHTTPHLLRWTDFPHKLTLQRTLGVRLLKKIKIPALYSQQKSFSNSSYTSKDSNVIFCSTFAMC